MTEDQEKILIENYLQIPSKRLAAMIGLSDTAIRGRMRQLGLKVPDEIIERRIQDSRIKPGNVPVNKGKKQSEYMSPEMIERTKLTRFKKGDRPLNKTEIGTIKLRTSKKKRGFKNTIKSLWIKTGDGALEWTPLHVFNWLSSGREIPPGMMVSFRDGDPLNCDVANLELISRQENMQRNTIHNLPPDLKEVVYLKGAITRVITKHTRRN